MTYVIGVALTLAVLIGLSLAALHLGYQAPRIREQGTPGNLGLAYETVHIPTVSGKRLFAWLLPVPGASTSIIILHGWGGNAELMLPMALPFQRAGINVLLIDARNHAYENIEYPLLMVQDWPAEADKGVWCPHGVCARQRRQE
jgi:pimeloyl-ACP methyl ester carboxylesterase